MEKKALLNSEYSALEEGTKARKEVDKKTYLKLALVVVIVILAIGSSLIQLQILWIASGETFHAGIPSSRTVRVAAYEQKLVNVDNATTRKEALVAIRANLANIQKQAEIASDQGVKVIVFAEYGITGDMGTQDHKRSSVYPYMEEIPDVSVTKPACVSCDKIDPKVEGQTTIGCIALKYNMYVLANLIESVPCDNTLDNQCPSDGHYQYNTNIVYNPKGCLIAKYHKYHRFSEEFVRIDKPLQPEYVYFDTEYGRFGTMICMDAFFKEPGLGLAQTYGIDHLLFSTYWDNSKDYAYERAVSWQLAFATVANVNFVGANVHSIEDFVFGSSILSGSEVISYTAKYNTSKGTLIIGDLPASKPKPNQQTHSRHNHLTEPSPNRQIGSVIIYGDLFDVVALDNLTGSTQVCQNGICCAIDYVRNTTEETFIVGAFKGSHTLEENVVTEVCLVTKCRNETLSSCGAREIFSKTAFSHLELSAVSSVKHVYPSLSPSDFKYEHLNWSFQHSGFFNSIVSTTNWPMTGIALVGRDFEKDPQV